MSSSDDEWSWFWVVVAATFAALVAVTLWYPWQVPTGWTGVQPSEIPSYSCGPSGSQGAVSCSPAGTAAFSWTVPPDVGVTSETGLFWLGRVRAFSGVAGGLELEDTDDCPATVEWSLAVRDAAGTTTPLAHGRLSPSATSAPDDEYPLVAPARRLQLSFRRADDLGCAATVHWSEPTLHRSSTEGPPG